MKNIRVEGDIAYIKLPSGHEAIIDASDIELVESIHWHAAKCRRTMYVKHTTPRNENGKQETIRLHRLIMGHPIGMQVDHINGNGLDNRRENLRVATANQNQHNRRPNLRSVSGIKGVTWRHDLNRWQAGIRLNGKAKNLGSFGCTTAAALAYAKASAEMHRDFGRTK